MPGPGANDLNAGGVYTDSYYECVNHVSESEYWQEQFESMGGAFEDDATPGAASPATGDCYGSTPLGKATIQSSKQETFSSGVDLKWLNSQTGFGFNIDLSALDGWASDTVLVYTMGAVGHPYCGEHGYPGMDGSDAVVVH
jgi:hypothetical protein